MKMTRKFKKIVCAIALVIVAVTVSAVIGHLSGGFQNKPSDWDLQTVNEANLYQSVSFMDENGVILNGADGVAVKLLEDNVLKVSGTAEKEFTQVIGTVTLKANTSYVFDSTLPDGSNGTAYMAIATASGEILATCYGEPVVIPASELTADTTVELRLHVANEHKLGSITLKPVLCEGDGTDDLVKFYE